MVLKHGEHSVVTLNRHNKAKFVSTAQEGHPRETQQLPPIFRFHAGLNFGTVLMLLLAISLVVNRNVFQGF